MAKLGISEHVTLQLNTLGETDERVAYKSALVEYLTTHQEALDDDSKRRLNTNPLRILDSKDENTQQILKMHLSLVSFWVRHRWLILKKYKTICPHWVFRLR